MITGLGINPFNPRGLGLEGSMALNETIDGAVLTDPATALATSLGSVDLPAASVVSALQADVRE